MNNMELFEDVIEYIEEHLEEKIEVSHLANILCVSVYEFRRIFSFIAGVPLSDYIRKRRLSGCVVFSHCGIECKALENNAVYGRGLGR